MAGKEEIRLRNWRKLTETEKRCGGCGIWPERKRAGGDDIGDMKRFDRRERMGTMLRFAGPMILGNLLQQSYNMRNSIWDGIWGRMPCAVGSAYTLMTFLTSY